MENRIKEIENKIKRIKFLIEFNKAPHKFKDHFTEFLSDGKKNTQCITESLHGSLLNIRDKWKNIANKKYLQEISLENMRTEIKNLKKESKQKILKKNNKYINTEDVIPEEIHDTEMNEEDKKVNKKPENIETNIKNIKLFFDKDNMKEIKLSMKDMEKLLKLNMNINVNINLNQQYINNQYNTCEFYQSNENIRKKPKNKY